MSLTSATQPEARVRQSGRKYAHRDLCFFLSYVDPAALGDVDLPDMQLYNLAKDPGETKNLAKEHPDRVKAMTHYFGAWSRSPTMTVACGENNFHSPKTQNN